MPFHATMIERLKALFHVLFAEIYAEAQIKYHKRYTYTGKGYSFVVATPWMIQQQKGLIYVFLVQ
jgi:hypothetical protein